MFWMVLNHFAQRTFWTSLNVTQCNIVTCSLGKIIWIWIWISVANNPGVINFWYYYMDLFFIHTLLACLDTKGSFSLHLLSLDHLFPVLFLGDTGPKKLINIQGQIPVVRNANTDLIFRKHVPFGRVHVVNSPNTIHQYFICSIHLKWGEAQGKKGETIKMREKRRKTLVVVAFGTTKFGYWFTLWAMYLLGGLPGLAYHVLPYFLSFLCNPSHREHLYIHEDPQAPQAQGNLKKKIKMHLTFMESGQTGLTHTKKRNSSWSWSTL